MTTAELWPELFREIIANFPAGVVVATAFDAAGQPRGLTASAFCPVSLEPPLILVCIDRTSNTLPAICETGGFTVNILSAGNEELARRMATKAADKFEGLRWQPADAPGGPVLEDHTVAHAVCALESTIEAGDHLICLGRLLGGGVHAGAVPLVYIRRAFIELGG